jgi:hypothetical protein
MVSPSTFHLPVSSSVSYVKEGKLLKHYIGTAWCYNFNFNHCFQFLQQVSADTNNMKIVECVSQHSMKWISRCGILIFRTIFDQFCLCNLLVIVHHSCVQFCC